MKHPKVSVILVFGTLLVCIASSCKGRDGVTVTSKPVSEVLWLGKGGGFTEWSTCGPFIIGISGTPDILEAYGWQGNSIVERKAVSVDGAMDVTWTTTGRYYKTTQPKRKGAWSLSAVDSNSDEILWQQPPQECFFISLIGVSANGKYVCLKMTYTARKCGYNQEYSDHAMRLLALVPPDEDKYTVVATLKGSHGGADCIRTMVPSNDGKYILLCGWENSGIALIDTESGKQLWLNKPKNAVHPGEGVFSADGTRVYVGGGAGAVYVLDSKTGKELYRWWANDTGKMEYGHRISCIATSPDGRFVAAGTGPEGFVYLWDSQTGKVVRRFDHKLTTILVLSFSPDSKYLASMAGGKVKIWELPTADKTATVVTPKKQPTEQN